MNPTSLVLAAVLVGLLISNLRDKLLVASGLLVILCVSVLGERSAIWPTAGVLVAAFALWSMRGEMGRTELRVLSLCGLTIALMFLTVFLAPSIPRAGTAALLALLGISGGGLVLAMLRRAVKNA